MLDLKRHMILISASSVCDRPAGHCKERQHSMFIVTTISAAARRVCCQPHPDKQAGLAVAAAAEDPGQQQHVGVGGGARLRRAGREHGRGRV